MGYPNGTTWTNLVDAIVDPMINPTFCPSPNGAFVD